MKWISLNLLAVMVALGSAGCEVGKCGDPGEEGENTEKVTDEDNCTSFKSLKEFRGTPQVNNVPYTSGKKVIVEVTNGSIDVIEGTVSDAVAVTVTPFVMRAFDTPEAEAEQSMEKLIVDVRNDANDNVIVSVSRQDNANTWLRGDTVVEVPQGFDGALEVNPDLGTGNGSIDVSYGGSVPSATVRVNNGSIDVNLGTVVDLTAISGNGSVTAQANSVSWFDIESGNGDIEAGFGAIAAGTTQTDDSLIGTELGDITLSLPADGVFSVQAAADDLVTFDPYPATCSEQVAAENSKTLSCGTGGPNIQLFANQGVGGVITVGVQ